MCRPILILTLTANGFTLRRLNTLSGWKQIERDYSRYSMYCIYGRIYLYRNFLVTSNNIENGRLQ